ncbi:CobD/CbiB family cobalamin biosynthesis protein [Halobaculum sp. MBLA0147]|uniref:CobD/CbiB family cobalamin biosynthesis protein n=1 Tax=Halobaculum sp. MBLA0147 TaxID=3079934 RepID=UPI0035244A7D
MSLVATAALLVAAGLDAAVGEPPARVHPVALFGRVVAPVDRAWGHPLTVGVVVAVVAPLIAAGLAGGVVLATAWLASAGVAGSDGDAVVVTAAAALAAGLVVFVTTSLRLLLAEARAVIAATTTDLDAARTRLRSLAGRDASELSAGAVRSAAVESVAENLADGLVAPLTGFVLGVVGWTVVGPAVAGTPSAGLSSWPITPQGVTTVSPPVIGLAVGAAAATWVKGVNTLDSMLGYRSKRVGTPSARLDDAVMWLPARLATVLVAVAAGAPGAVRAARRHADTPDSPNSGWPMATLAAVLGVRLRKPETYELPYGDDLPSPAAARHGVRVAAVAGVASYAVAAVTLLATVAATEVGG